MRTALIDYGSGNIASAAKALSRAAGGNQTIAVTPDPDVVRKADRIVLPGVGAFADCMAGLSAVPGMIDALNESVIKKGAPFLGICVGMQLMATAGREFGVHPGLNWIEGEVVPVKPADPALKIPHMGWNTLRMMRSHALLEGIPTGEEGQHAYFVHSYHFVPADEAALVASTDYGGPISAFIAKDNMAGTQFHPEKSQKLGLALIANFLKWKP